VRFRDSSAVVPLLVKEPSTAEISRLRKADSDVTVWWATVVECAAAVGRLERNGEVPVAVASTALARLRELAEGWHEVQPFDDLRETARRFVAHPRSTVRDALQLAAAFHAAEGRPSSLTLVVLDTRVADAAAREGFEILPGDRQRG
jgi:predicted nucleic acid-binding protein